MSTLLTGGAGGYALDYHRLLLKLGYNSFLIVKDSKKYSFEQVVQYPRENFKFIFAKFRRWFFRLLIDKFHFDSKYLFLNKLERINCYSAKTILNLLPQKPDVIIFYWNSGFVNSKLMNDLAKITDANIYIWLLDNAPLTGGCHYPWDCVGYQHNCGICPAITNKFLKNRLAKFNLAFKVKYNLPSATIISSSESDTNRLNKSTLFRFNSKVKILAYVDNERFLPAHSKKPLREKYNISEHDKIIFFGVSNCDEKRKGINQFVQALKYINTTNVVLLIAGNLDLSFKDVKAKCVGYVSEDDLIELYQVADVFLCPSLEDSGPLMINQSIMCGTPVVAFEMGVAMDLVLTGRTGYRAKLNDFKDFATGIDYVLSLDDSEYKKMSTECRELALSLYGTAVIHENTLKII